MTSQATPTASDPAAEPSMEEEVVYVIMTATKKFNIYKTIGVVFHTKEDAIGYAKLTIDLNNRYPSIYNEMVVNEEDGIHGSSAAEPHGMVWAVCETDGVFTERDPTAVNAGTVVSGVYGSRERAEKAVMVYCAEHSEEMWQRGRVVKIVESEAL
ncbi:MAG: hypothetical protein Q9169_005855 [Polycauliona sp. 2 TL-2023]